MSQRDSGTNLGVDLEVAPPEEMYSECMQALWLVIHFCFAIMIWPSCTGHPALWMIRIHDRRVRCGRVSWRYARFGCSVLFGWVLLHCLWT
ncbi:hypothetical protein L210DRAFT_3525754, partial [Boletus edulis BED1]